MAFSRTGAQGRTVNIWIFNPYDPLPGEGLGELRYANLARALLNLGDGVTSPPSGSYGVTSPPSGSYGVTWFAGDWSHTLKRRRCLEGGGDGVDLQLIPVPAYRKNISLRRVWSHWCYARGIAKRAEACVAAHGKPDVIVFSVPPMEAGGVALRLGKRYRCRVVLDVMDAWPDTLLLAVSTANHRWGWANGLVRGFGTVLLTPYRRMMRRYCREADRICAQSQAFADYARSFGATGEIPVFYLGAEGQGAEGGGASSESPHASLDATDGRRSGEKRPLRLLYLGSMGRVYDLETLIRAVLRLLDDGAAVRLDVVGEGEQRAGLEAMVATAGRLDAIHFHGYLSGDSLDAVMASADVGVVPMMPGSQVAVPYKACTYLAAGLPLINSLPGELAENLLEYGCGHAYVAGDCESLAVAVRNWTENPDRLIGARAGARRLFAEHFDAGKIYPAYAEWLLASEEK